MANLYGYRARNPAGKVVTGQIQADDINRAAALLRDKQLVVLDLAPGKAKSKGLAFFKKKAIPLKQFAVFCRQMSTMVRAGVTIMSSISAISAQAENPLLSEVLVEVGKDLEAGKTFTEACQKHKEFFPNIFTSMVEAGEASGALDTVLEELADYFESQSEIREKIKSATTYPSFIGAAAVLVVIVLMLTVIPGFATMFEDMGAEMPAITQAALSFSEFLQNYWYIVIPGLIGGFLGIRYYFNTTKGRHVWQRFSLRLPKFGTLFQNTALARLCRTLSILIGAGVPMMQALEIVARVVNNIEFSSAILHARKSVSQGQTLSQGLAVYPRFTPLMLHMLKVGEDAGAMDEMLAKVADFYESEVRYTVERLSSIIEPLMILGLALIVGTILASVMLPMFDIADLVD